MKFLLDTNIFIFLIDKDYKRLSVSQVNIVNDVDNELFISEASLFEIAIKIRIGKQDFSHIHLGDVDLFRKKIGIKIIKSTFDHYENLVSVPKILKKDGKPHADPFDLLIIATAQKENLPILSSDEYFPEYSIISTIS
jgi:PIN domain nuclease of toxin-antitoxin system